MVSIIIISNQLYGQASLINIKNKIRRDEKTGIPVAIYNVHSKQYSGTPVQIAKQYLNENSTLLKLDKNLENLQFFKVKKSPAGKHVGYRQVYKGIPVMRSESVVSINHANRVIMVINHCMPEISINTRPTIGKDQAIEIARNSKDVDISSDLCSPITQLMVYKDSVSVFHLVWEVRIFPSDQNASWFMVVDSHNGEILETINMMVNFVNGTGRVFDPDPGTALGDSTLPDNNDADYAGIQSAYDIITLLDLNSAVDDSYRVQGKYAWSINEIDIAGNDEVVAEINPYFMYNRSHKGFEEVNIYYFIDKLRRYIESLDPDFDPEWVFKRGTPDSIRSESIRFDARGSTILQASYESGLEYMHFGVPSDTIDTGEDQSAIIHEYGHALHDALLSGNGLDGVSFKLDTYGISEGLADYLQISYRRSTQPSNPFRPNHRSNWAIPNPVTYAKSILPPESAKYPEPPEGHWAMSYYDKMLVWASTLMEIEYNVATDPSQGERLGRDITTKLMLTSLSYVTSSSTVQDNVYAILQADRDIPEYSGQHLSELAEVFRNRGFFYYEEVYDPITSDETWSGYLVLTDDITVSNNVTLTISPGTFVFGNDHQITVNGTLDINGTADSRVTISETYIYANSGSIIEIDYADISDSYSHGLYVNNSTAKINNSTFSNNADIGIYLNYPQSGSEIENCTFTNNLHGGVKINSGSPLDIKNCTFTGNGVFGLYLGSVNIPNDRIADNWFEDNYDGIYFASGGNANLTTTRIDPWNHQGNPGEAYLNNIIKDNDRYGAWVSYSSTPMLGSHTFIGGDENGYYWYGGFNAFVNAGAFKYIRNYGTSYIDIRLNFWDVDAEDVTYYLIGNFNQSEASNLYINPGSLSKSAGVNIAGTYTNEKHQLSPLEVQLLEGDSLLITNHLDQAFEVYERIINNSPDANEARVALNRIIYIYWNQEKQNDLISWLNGIHAKFPKKLIGTIAYDYTTPLLVMEGNIDQAISRNDEVVNNYDRLNEPEYAAESLYENMMIYENMAMESSGSGRVPKLNAANASSKMYDYISRILSKYPETSTAELLREEYHHELPEPISTIIPTKYELHACYPNPFNPLTNIVFEIPEEAKVSLVIYDLAGRTVWEKPNNNSIMSVGQYTYQWDGRNLNNVQVATGIYFIRLKTPRHIQTRKVVFIK